MCLCQLKLSAQFMLSVVLVLTIDSSSKTNKHLITTRVLTIL